MYRWFSALGAAVGVAAVALAIGLAATSCGDTSKKPGCAGDKDCKSPLVCSAGTCVECTADNQCPTGKICSANACILAAECTSDETCPPGKVCQAGKCKACASDNECGPGGTCDAGACKRGKKCGTDAECADDEDCVSGVCKKASAAGNPADAPCALSTVYFAFDNSSVQPSERDRLAANVACIESVKGKMVHLIGHTDSSGTEEYNIALSERRAQAVADYMSRLGSDPARLQIVPKGETEPTGQGDDKDRRVEFQWH
jgi:peptidoglycan-associated lipoprotein